MKWRKVDAKTWENNFSKRFDFIVNKEKGRFILDIFNKRVKNISQSYIGSFELRTLKEAKYDAENYI